MGTDPQMEEKEVPIEWKWIGSGEKREDGHYHYKVLNRVTPVDTMETYRVGDVVTIEGDLQMNCGLPKSSIS